MEKYSSRMNKYAQSFFCYIAYACTGWQCRRGMLCFFIISVVLKIYIVVHTENNSSKMYSLRITENGWFDWKKQNPVGKAPRNSGRIKAKILPVTCGKKWPLRHKSGNLTDNRSTTKCSKEFLYMKATGIVRRIDDCGIITQRGLCRINTGVLLILSKN